MGLLGEILEVFNRCFDETEDSSRVVEILTELTKSSRFSLALNFLGKDEKRAVSLLLWHVEERLNENGWPVILCVCILITAG